MKRLIFPVVLLVGVCSVHVTPVLAQHEHPAGDPGKLGKVSFPVSCDPSVQPQFSSAVAMLHSPPSDCRVVQVAPEVPMRTARTTRDKGALDHDYKHGREMGQAAMRVWAAMG